MTVAASEYSEGTSDIAKARQGDLSQSYNFARDTWLGGNKELYNAVKYGSVMVAAGGTFVLTGGAASLIMPAIGGGLNLGITLGFDRNLRPGETLLSHYMSSFTNGFVSGGIAGKFFSGLKCGASAINIYSRSVAAGFTAGTVQDVMSTGQTDVTSNLTRSAVGGAFSFLGNTKASTYVSSVVGDMVGSMADDYRKHGNVKESLTIDNLKKSLISSLANLVTRSDPVDVVKGRFYFTATDLVVYDIGPSIEMVRTYNSIHRVAGATGKGFTFTYESSLQRVKDHILVICTDGHYESFILQGDQWVNERGGKQEYALTENIGMREYVLQDLQRNAYVYDFEGRLLRITDRSGNQTVLHYNHDGLYKLTTPGGKEIKFTYEAGKL